MYIGFGYSPSRAERNVGVAFDADAQAFFTAASITDNTQKSAVNQLVLDLKFYNIWTKMKAIYPIVGGSASSHAVNLKTPGTYNLTFATGMTHSSNGMVSNGTSGYANTSFNPSVQLTQNSASYGLYSRTNRANSDDKQHGVINGSIYTLILIRNLFNNIQNFLNSSTSTAIANSDSRGFFQMSRTTSTNTFHSRNNSVTTVSLTSNGNPNGNVFFCCRNLNGTPNSFDDVQISFAYCGEGLTDTEMSNFYTAVQAYQTTLGRSIGTQTVSDSDAQAFVNAATITDQVEATAVNNLVIGLKEDSLWTKMKAIYPIVGGSASSHAVNLKTPSTYNLTFSTGWTHESTGMTPNGSSAFADTGLSPNVMSLNSIHGSVYLRLNNNSNGPAFSSELASTFNNGFYVWPKQPTTNQYSVRINDNTSAAAVNGNIQGLNIITRTASNVKKYRIKTTQILNLTTPSTGSHTESIYLGKSRNNANYYTNSYAFLSFGDGFTDTECNDLNTRVQNFQTQLNRQV